MLVILDAPHPAHERFTVCRRIEEFVGVVQLVGSLTTCSRLLRDELLMYLRIVRAKIPAVQRRRRRRRR